MAYIVGMEIAINALWTSYNLKEYYKATDI